MFSISSIPEDLLRKIKTGIYGFQTLLVSIAWILTLAVLTKSGVTGSATKFYFFLTWISIPAFTYLAVVPLWQRTQRFVNVHATATLDVSFTIFWLSAFCAVQVWTDGGINSSKGCADFAYGSESKCRISYGTAILAIMIFILWLPHSFLSIYTLIHLHKYGHLPHTRPSISKPYFSDGSTSELGPQPTEKSAPKSRLDHSRTGSEATSVHTETEHGLHPGRLMSYSKTPPLTAPVTFTATGVPQYGGVPQWRTIYYSNPEQEPNERSPLRGSAPPPPPSASQATGGQYKPRRQSPPSLGFFRPANVYPPPPPQLQIFAPPAEGYVENPYAKRASLSTQVPAGQGYAAYDSLRDVMRGPVPGPASEHRGGWRSAYHTPLPSAVGGAGFGGVRGEEGGRGNSWRDERGAVMGERTSGGGRLVFPEAERSRRYY
ncbi:hypothetical protein MMC30_005351 [Trapelia coarctata]|nr:hypothetical protein [Trapelia coarctata]